MFSLKEILMENPTVSFLTQFIYVLISCLKLLGVHITKASYVRPINIVLLSIRWDKNPLVLGGN